MVTLLFSATPSNSFGMSDKAELAAGPMDLGLILFSWPGGIYYIASLLGTPFEGVLYSGEPLIMDVPNRITIEFEIVNIDEELFTLQYRVTYYGTVLFDAVESYPHGHYVIFHNPFTVTPMIWHFDFNIFWYNGPGVAHLWALYRTPDSQDISYVSASEVLGDTDVSFTFPDFLDVDAFVSEFGDTTNTYDYYIESPWTTYQGRQYLPFGCFTIAYQSQPHVAFQVAEQGCSVAHCDVRMSDIANMPAPTGWDTQILWHDPVPAGMHMGLGCSSNGETAVCTYQDTTGDNLVAYDARGNRLWTSGHHLGTWAWPSIAMIDDLGGVIATDDEYLIQFRPDGTVKWKTATPGGIPHSPVITNNGVVITTPYNGPLAAFCSVTGNFLGHLYLTDTPGSTDYYDTDNTPCVLGNRFYVSTAKKNDPDHTARLWAVDVEPGHPEGVMRVKWSFLFGGPSGASPMIDGDTIFFDGDRLNPGEDLNPHIFAVQDHGDTCSLKWAHPMDTPVKASLAKDPRGGVWSNESGRKWLYRFDQETGDLLDSLDVDALVDEPELKVPSSVMTIAGDASQPIMIIGTVADVAGLPAWVIAIDLAAEALLWKIKLSDDWTTEFTAAQFAIVEDEEGNPVVVFPSSSSGAYGVGAP